MISSKTVHLLGYASGLGSADPGTCDGPLVLQQSPYLSALSDKGITLEWQEIIKPEAGKKCSKLALISKECEKLAKNVSKLVENKEFFTVFGGDHSSAIGTWSGVHHGLKNQGKLGLIWIDAHMDSHTPHTSPTGNIHGMPLACLLGYGMPLLINMLDEEPKLKPEHVSLIGVRSYEAGEAALLKELKVRIFYMEEVLERGLAAVMEDAIKIASTGTAGFGITIDIDSMDPKDAPGTGVAESNGLASEDLVNVLSMVANNSKLLGVEIAEFDPHRDKDAMTEKLIPQLIEAYVLGKPTDDNFKNRCSNSANAGL